MMSPYPEPPAVGNAAIDDQHARWTGIANRLAASVERGHGDEVIGAILSELADLSAAHFSHEEYLMGRCIHARLMDEATASEHTRVHDALLTELGRLVYEFEFSKPVVTGDTVAFIRCWYADHVGTYDAVLGAALRALNHVPR